MNPQNVNDLINAGYYGYRGWNSPEALADFRATGGAGKGGATSTSTTQPQTNTTQSYGSGPINLANQALQTYQPYIEKAAGFINQGLSDVKSSYQSLLDSVKKRTETNVAEEYGRRGIPISSGIVSQAQNEQVAANQAPIFASLADKTNAAYGNLAGLYGGVGNFLQSLGIGDVSAAQALASATRAPIDSFWPSASASDFPQSPGASLPQTTTNTNNYSSQTPITGYPGVQRLADGSPAVLGGGATTGQIAGYRAQQTAQEAQAAQHLAQAQYPSIFNLFGLLQR